MQKWASNGFEASKHIQKPTSQPSRQIPQLIKQQISIQSKKRPPPLTGKVYSEAEQIQVIMDHIDGSNGSLNDEDEAIPIHVAMALNQSEPGENGSVQSRTQEGFVTGQWTPVGDPYQMFIPPHIYGKISQFDRQQMYMNVLCEIASKPFAVERHSEAMNNTQQIQSQRKSQGVIVRHSRPGQKQFKSKDSTDSPHKINSSQKKHSMTQRQISPLQALVHQKKQTSAVYQFMVNKSLKQMQESDVHSQQLNSKRRQATAQHSYKSKVFNSMYGGSAKANVALLLPVRHNRVSGQMFDQETQLIKQLTCGKESRPPMVNKSILNDNALRLSFRGSRGLDQSSRQLSDSKEGSFMNRRLTGQTKQNSNNADLSTRFQSNTNMQFITDQSRLGNDSMKKVPSLQSLQKHSPSKLFGSSDKKSSSKGASVMPISTNLSMLALHQRQNSGDKIGAVNEQVKLRDKGYMHIKQTSSIDFSSIQSKANLNMVGLKVKTIKKQNINAPASTLATGEDQFNTRVIIKNIKTKKAITQSSKPLEKRGMHQQSSKKIIKSPVAIEKKKIQRWRQQLQQTIQQQRGRSSIERIVQLEQAYLPMKLLESSFEESFNKVHSMSRQRATERGEMLRTEDSRTKSAYSRQRLRSKNSSKQKGSLVKIQTNESRERSLSKCKCETEQQEDEQQRVNESLNISLTVGCQSQRDLGALFSGRNLNNRHRHGCHAGTSFEDQERFQTSVSRNSQQSRPKHNVRSKSRQIDEGPKICQRCLKHKVYQRPKSFKYLSDSQRFEANQFRDAMKDLGKKRSMSTQNILKSRGLSTRSSVNNTPMKKIGQKESALKRNARSQMSNRAPTLAQRMKQIDKSKQKTKDKNRWELLRNQSILQQADWFKSNLYRLYQKHGRNLVKGNTNDLPQGAILTDSVFTETELQYYIEFLQKMSMKKYREDVTEKEIVRMLEGHNVKAYSTLKWLMKLIGFDYYYERILFRYQNQEQIANSKNLNAPAAIHNVIKVMVRSLQMYETIDQILLIFQLLAKIEKLNQDSQNKTIIDSPTQTERHLHIRLIAVIKQLISNNKFLQKRFIFNGVVNITYFYLKLQDVINSLEKKVKELNLSFRLREGERSSSSEAE